MADTPTFGTIDVTDFTVGAMLRAGIAVRRTVRGSTSLESAAELIVRYLYDQCRDGTSGDRSCALVRFYKTHRFGGLAPEDQGFVAGRLGGAKPSPDLQCLTLLATAGDLPEWNARHESRGHRAIPLVSTEAVRNAPMIFRLIEDIGLDVEKVVGGQGATRGAGAPSYDVFHVERALGSPFIPAQQDFVMPHRIESVVGFGGLLRTGELFAVILFSRDPIPAASAARFRAIALDVRSSLFGFDHRSVWKE